MGSDNERSDDIENTLWDVTDDDADLGVATKNFHLGQARALLGEVPYTATRPCPRCNGTDAVLRRSGGQNVVSCRSCRIAIYNAPKHETGEKPRTVASLRRDIKPSQQQRVLERDGGACVLCHRSDVPLQMGHVLSMKDAQALDESGPYLYSDKNLVTMCEACNLGLGERSLLPLTYARIVLRLLQAAEKRSAATGAAPRRQVAQRAESIAAADERIPIR